MATTPGGLPYPVGTDYVVDGDNAIRALAEAIEAKYGRAGVALIATAAGPIGGEGQMQYNSVLANRGFTLAGPPYTGITIPAAGIYAIDATMSVSQAAGGYFNLTVKRNGVTLQSATGSVYPHTSTVSRAVITALIVDCVAGDIITVTGASSSTGSVDANSALLAVTQIAKGA